MLSKYNDRGLGWQSGPLFREHFSDYWYTFSLAFISNLNQNHSLLCSYQPNPDNLDSQYQEQNDSEREETINESDAENTEEDKEIESGNEKEEVETDDQQDDIPSGNAVISADTAKQIAESFLNTGSATKIVLDDENGKLVYSIEIGSSEVKVDALTGAVINTNKQ